MRNGAACHELHSVPIASSPCACAYRAEVRVLNIGHAFLNSVGPSKHVAWILSLRGIREGLGLNDSKAHYEWP